MAGDRGGTVDWAAVEIAAAGRLGTGMGVGIRLTGDPRPGGFEQELDRARRIYATPRSMARLARIVGLPVTDSAAPAVQAATEAFCRALAAAATATGQVPVLRDMWARKGLAGMITQPEAEPGPPGITEQVSPGIQAGPGAAAWPQGPAARTGQAPARAPRRAWPRGRRAKPPARG